MNAGATIRQWLTRRQGASVQSSILTRQQIFILPTRAGFLLALVLFAMLLAALNYNNSLAFLFTFLVGGIAGNSMWFTHRQLAGLKLHALPQNNLFAGQAGEIRILLENPTNYPRFSLRLSASNPKDTQIYDCGPGEQIVMTLPVRPARRGRFKLERIILSTEAPLGLFHAWSWQYLDIGLWVYPKPIAIFPAPLQGDEQREGITSAKSSGDEFDGLREYHAGDPPRRIAWKHQAHADTLLVKEFSQPQQHGRIFSWNALAAADTETKLSWLCYWIVEAEKSHQTYGLKIPGCSIAPGNGDRHYQQCLEALAAYGSNA